MVHKVQNILTYFSSIDSIFMNKVLYKNWFEDNNYEEKSKFKKSFLGVGIVTVLKIVIYNVSIVILAHDLVIDTMISI